MKSIKLQDGTLFPAFGLGTWQAGPGEVYKAVRTALELGYRHLDCAAIYQNEEEIGKAIQDAIKAGDVTREELWVTSKLWNDSHLKKDVRPAIEKTLKDLRLEYLDLYLIHWLVAVKHGVVFARTRDEFLSQEEAPITDTWEAMCELKDAGLTKHVGVSNMAQKRILELSKVGYQPEVVQVEAHPHFPQNELLGFCKEHEIGFTAYSPLGSAGRSNRAADEPALLDHPVVEAVAERNNITTGQVLIAWAHQRGTSVIPKSANPKRIAENLAATKVELPTTDMHALEQLNSGYRYLNGTFFTGPESPYTIEELFL